MLATWGTSTGFNPASLFAGGVQGAWYDPSDFPPNWRVNLLTYTEQFNNTAGWLLQVATISANATTAPDGTLTADSFQSSGAGTGFVYQTISASATTYTLSIYAKANSTDQVRLDFVTGGFGLGGSCTFTLTGAGSAGAITQYGVSTGFTASIQSVGNGWYRCTMTGTATAATWFSEFAVAGGVQSVFLWGAQLQLGSTATAYQQIVTPEISFLQYNPQPVMYTSSLAENPVTAVEQAVGLILDKSKGLVIGADASNGVWLNTFTTTFDTFTSTSSSGFTGTTTGAKSPRVRLPINFVASTWYWIEFTISLTNATASVTMGTDAYGGVGIQPASVSTSGTYRILNTGTATTSAMFSITATGAATVVVSNFTIRPLPGNHAYQTTSASRPTLRARYNLLTYSEEIGNVLAWTVSNASISANATTAPDGTLTADKLIENTANSTHVVLQLSTGNVASRTYTFSVYAKQSERSWLYLVENGGSSANAYFDLANGVLGTVSGTATASITAVGSGWYRCLMTFTLGAAQTTANMHCRLATANGVEVYTGDGTSGLFLWGAQLIAPAVFPSNTYQRIAAATDYATGAAFPQYLAFDGTDDSLLTANVDFATVTSDGAARRNLLLNPTQFDAAGWTQQQTTVTANSTAAPDGTSTADKVIPDTNVLAHAVRTDVTTTVQSYAFSVYAKAAEYIWITLYNTTGGWGKTFNLQTGTVGTATIGPASTATIENVGNGWYRCILVGTATAASNAFRIYINNGDTIAPAFAGDGTSGLFLWGAQLETGSTATAFQNIGTDKMTVFSGVSKLSDTTTAMIVELSAGVTTNNGSFYFIGPTGAAGNNYQYVSKGTVSDSGTSGATFASPITNVVTGQSDIGAPSVSLRVNGTLAQARTATQGTGNFLTYPLFIGRRNNASLSFNGRIYSLIVRGAASNSSQVAQTERYVASKTPLGVVP